MLTALRSLLVPKPPEAVRATYIALVAQARNPFFYTTLGVPDTLDGRFEVIVLHLFFLQHRLRAADPGFAQSLSEAFFIDMDRSLRELGIADTGVAHRIKAMGKAYHGRLQAYTAGLLDPAVLLAALARNLYGTVEDGHVALLERAAAYVTQTAAAVEAADAATITGGMFPWPAPL
jgi:cytochrome b pre-mRNA-processing protein 3